MLESATGCPYLKRLGNEVHYSISGYCERTSICALRVPTQDEVRGFCSTGNYRHCPIYRRGIETEPGDPKALS